MAESGKSAERAWLRGQVAAYKEAFPRYQKYADILEDVLSRKAKEIAPLTILQTWPKNVASFAGKVVRKRSKYRNPAPSVPFTLYGRESQAEARSAGGITAL